MWELPLFIEDSKTIDSKRYIILENQLLDDVLKSDLLFIRKHESSHKIKNQIYSDKLT
ncbi:hypothetical protein LEP1GSC020_1371 [Leptospira interrogans serovar Grippotyphosa str. 2006006986]|uniref:Uncharacterized protein n=2 Tax=Leptospira interrogans TaxID=173 RepID=M3ETS6_LEPIR|nr:hypothetical protein G436_2878 [Leptospira interrogans serovar Hardjo str. Norma]EKO85792.1 hypothetical protein LEP1GSC009_2658 [Leptospira interrogans serovar Grippotyphosa str. Andaman]EKP85748.1 hypothetical protein LEP1GSC020_1371 [Leptospira interrogans serovar Grippotyphosa str. 2006006986]EKR16882.1 hypothetical protein LEP1GSC019_2693 [Leptospira interrogans serovar Pyrogenes str. 2006006960]EMF41201.1 hypothetical protein LEP1GSC067_0713 [Leptospira interrogans serovar Lora str. TE